MLRLIKTGGRENIERYREIKTESEQTSEREKER